MQSRRSVLTGGSAALIAGAAPRVAWGKTETDVIVIGAGLAGLYAAHRLEVEGKRVIIVEGERRVGGRLHTLDDLPGKPDAGGIQVGANYNILRAIADDLKIDLIEDAPSQPAALYRINGTTITAAQWPQSSMNMLSSVERTTLPSALGSRYAGSLPGFDAPAGWMDATPAVDRPYEDHLVLQGASAEALRLIEANMNGNTLAGLSQLHIMRSIALANVKGSNAGVGPSARIKGGSQRLPEALAAMIRSPIRLGEVVSAIREDASGVSITTNRGIIRARHVICTIPFAALRHIAIEAPLNPAIATLIPSLSYTRASFAYISASSAFWKEDGLPETLWTDDPLLGRIFVLGDSPPMLKLWTVGAGADLLDRMAPASASAEIITRIEAARPSAKGKLKVERLYSWQKPPMARGIYHHIGTGQGALLAAAVRAKGKRLHFAGEHLAQTSSGMEGALESGGRVGRMVAEIS
jgi:monoamine oxidase